MKVPAQCFFAAHIFAFSPTESKGPFLVGGGGGGEKGEGHGPEALWEGGGVCGGGIEKSVARKGGWGKMGTTFGTGGVRNCISGV